jgi:hypothetical protein
VLRVVVRGYTLLLAGDAEEDEQANLEAAKVDILKVAHHGSAFQSPGFLDGTRPSVALDRPSNRSSTVDDCGDRMETASPVVAR